MPEHKFKKGDLVRVEESRQCYWKGRIIKIHTMGTMANVKDVNPNSSHYNSLFPVFLKDLEPWNSADNVNV